MVAGVVFFFLFFFVLARYVICFRLFASALQSLLFCLQWRPRYIFFAKHLSKISSILFLNFHEKTKIKINKRVIFIYVDTCISTCSSPIRVLWSHITQRGDIGKKMYFFQPFACSQKKVATFLILTATIYVRHDITRLRAVASSRLASVFFCHHENPKYLRREFNHTRCLCYNFFFWLPIRFGDCP